MKDGDISNESESVVYLDGRDFIYVPKKGWNKVRRKLKRVFSLTKQFSMEEVLSDIELHPMVYFSIFRLKRTYRIVIMAADAEDEYILLNLFSSSVGVSVVPVLNETILAGIILGNQHVFCVSNLYRRENPVFGAVQRYSSITDALRLLSSITPVAH